MAKAMNFKAIAKKIARRIAKAMNFKAIAKKITRRHRSSSLEVISLSEKGKLWQRAVGLFEEIHSQGLQATVTTYNVTIVLTPQYLASLEDRELMNMSMQVDAALQAVARMKAMKLILNEMKMKVEAMPFSETRLRREVAKKMLKEMEEKAKM